MKFCHFSKVALVLVTALFFTSSSHSWAQSQQFIFPPSAAALITGAASPTSRFTTSSPVLGALSTVSTPSTQSFTVFDPPNAVYTDSRSINASGDVTGYFYDGSNGKIRGFVRKQSGNISVFDAPNTSFTVSISINDGGDVTGYFIDTSQNNKERSFVRDRNGATTAFDAPNASTTASVSINASGTVTGVFFAASQSNKGRGFVRDQSGNISVFDAPNTSYTGPSSINAGGNITGFLNDVNPSLGSHGFVRDHAGSITVFDPPTSVSTGSSSINANGDVTGYFQGSQGGIRGFLRHLSGAIAVFDAPNTSFTFPFSINDGGDVAGTFSDASLMPGSPYGGKLRGFVRDHSGNVRVFEPNTAALTEIFGINNGGDMTGYFIDASETNKQRGFVRRTDTIPPVTTATPSLRPNANGWNNTNVIIALNATDPGGPGVKQIQFALGEAQNTGWQTVQGNAASVTISAEGTTVLSYFATDNAGNQEAAKTLTVQIDKTLPVISGLPAPGCTIWPPNHKLVKVATVTAADPLSGLAPGSFKITGTIHDPANGQIVITGGPSQFFVQLGADKDEVYMLTATASDLAGNTVTQQATCTVPHDQGK